MEKSAAKKRKCEAPNSKKLVKSVPKSSKKNIKIDSSYSTSGLSKTSGPINLIAEDSVATDIVDEDGDEGKCCVCNDWQPVELRQCQSIVFVSWAKCDFCEHWTHLKFCSDVRVLRTSATFKCPHCIVESA